MARTNIKAQLQKLLKIRFTGQIQKKKCGAKDETEKVPSEVHRAAWTLTKLRPIELLKMTLVRGSRTTKCVLSAMHPISEFRS